MLANLFDSFKKGAMKVIVISVLLFYFPCYNCDQELEHLLLSNGGWHLLQFLCLFLRVTN